MPILWVGFYSVLLTFKVFLEITETRSTKLEKVGIFLGLNR